MKIHFEEHLNISYSMTTTAGLNCLSTVFILRERDKQNMDKYSSLLEYGRIYARMTSTVERKFVHDSCEACCSVKTEVQYGFTSSKVSKIRTCTECQSGGVLQVYTGRWWGPADTRWRTACLSWRARSTSLRRRWPSSSPPKVEGSFLMLKI